MRYPHFLPEGGTVGFVAPSFGCNIEPYRTAFENTQRVLREKGYAVNLGPNCYEGSGVGISNTPQRCGEELNRFVTGSDCDVLIACGGGELMCEVLDFVDFEAIRNAPPIWYMGFSDNTNMTFLLPTLCDTAAIYGPNAPAFGMEPWHPSIEDAWLLLTGRKLTFSGYPLWEKESVKSKENPLAPYHVTEPRRLRLFQNGKTIQKARIQGRLLGGCLDCLENLAGTCFDQVSQYAEKYQEDGILWFLESCDLNPMGIRRAMWKLQHTGWFRHVKGFLIGRPYCYGAQMLGMDTDQAFLGVLQQYNVPVILDVDLGHLPPMMPLICGSVATVQVAEELWITMDLR